MHLGIIQKEMGNRWLPLVTASAVAAIVLFATLVNAGTPVLVLSGSSMAPALNRGDVVLLHKPHIAEIEVGDLVAFRADNQAIVVHRAIEKGMDSSGQTFIVTKGDSNQWNDRERIDESNYLGKVYYIIPRAGVLITTAQNPLVLLFLAVTIVAFIMYKKRDGPNDRPLLAHN